MYEDRDALTFTGRRPEELTCVVEVDGAQLAARLDLRNHSPTGFEWGYQGSGPAQLALAILARVAGDELALGFYQEFKREVVCHFPPEGFTLTGSEVTLWLLAKLKAEDRRIRDTGRLF